MKLFKWNPDYSVKIEKLDRQHESLFDLINQCHQLIEENRLNKEIRSTLHKLKQYTEEHFALEEEYMRRAGYKQLPEHINQHWQFVKTLIDLEEQFKIDKALLHDDIMAFLTDWLVKHIMNSDQDYTESLAKAGIFE